MATYTVVQSTPTINGGASGNGSFSVLPSAGNTIIVEVGVGLNGGNNPTAGVTDNQGNTYTQAVTVRDNGSRGEIWYCYNIPAPSGTFTVTISCAGGGGGNQSQGKAHEVSGLGTNDPLFATRGGVGGTITLTTTTPLVNPDAIAFSASMNEFAGASSLSSGAPWGSDYQLGNFNGAGAHAIISSAGTTSVSWSGSGGSAIVLAVFQDPNDFSGVRSTQITQSLVAQTTTAVRSTQLVESFVAQQTGVVRGTQIVLTLITTNPTTGGGGSVSVILPTFKRRWGLERFDIKVRNEETS
jgi:hypothetical protein